MTELTIPCPNCQTPVEVTSALRGPIEAQLRQSIEAKVREQEKALQQQKVQLEKRQSDLEQIVKDRCQAEAKKSRAEIESQVRETVSAESQALKLQVEQKSSELRDLKSRELEMLKLKAELDTRVESMDLEVQRKLDAERAAIRLAADKTAGERAALEVKDLTQKLADRQTALDLAQSAELKFRQERDTFVNEKKEFELERMRLIERERDTARRTAEEEHRLKFLENEKMVAGLKQQIEVLKQKAEQGSQQLQGEVQELDLESQLRSCFSRDTISEVGKGQTGADLLQQVSDDFGRSCGTIIWESKRTRNWQQSWLEKLKEDKRSAAADIAILVTTAMPKDVVSFACCDGVWVTTPPLAVALGWTLRFALTETATARRASEGRQDKMSLVYEYLCSNNFKSRLLTIHEAFSTMQHDLNKEKAAVQKLWAKREKQLERVIMATTGLGGELEGIMGGEAPGLEVADLARLTYEEE